MASNRMEIRGVAGLSPEHINSEVEKGAKFVIFQTCISLVLVTWREPTGIQFIKSNQNILFQFIPYSLVSFLFGWWGIPWGPIYTLMALVTNSNGGQDVTSDVIAAINDGVPYNEPPPRKRGVSGL